MCFKTFLKCYFNISKPCAHTNWQNIRGHEVEGVKRLHNEQHHMANNEDEFRIKS